MLLIINHHMKLTQGPKLCNILRGLMLQAPNTSYWKYGCRIKSRFAQLKKNFDKQFLHDRTTQVSKYDSWKNVPAERSNGARVLVLILIKKKMSITHWQQLSNPFYHFCNINTQKAWFIKFIISWLGPNAWQQLQKMNNQ